MLSNCSNTEVLIAQCKITFKSEDHALFLEQIVGRVNWKRIKNASW